MALPTQKRTKSSKRKRALQFTLKKINYTVCSKCGRPVLPHHLCSFCGTYGGKKILEPKFKGKKKGNKNRRKESKKGSKKESKKGSKT